MSIEQVEEKRIEKRKQKGGFEGRIFNHHVDIEEDNPAIIYLSHTKQYSQINHKEDDQDCLFCQMASGKKEVTLFAKFQHCYIIKDQFPVSPEHLLIIPYAHTENWFTASEEVRLDIIKALNFAKEQLDHTCKPDGYNIGANCGEVAGQNVMHLHVHLIPRYQGDMEDPKGGVRGVIPSKQKY
ncbi:MAG: HIT domain-containing protein [Parachlamydiaceae bacterium]